MLKKYISKFAMDILPSVAATIIGAYVVNHYIVTKPAANAPVTAAVSTTEPQAEAKVAPEAAKAGSKAPGTSSDVANIPEAGRKARDRRKTSGEGRRQSGETRRQTGGDREYSCRNAPPPAGAARKADRQGCSGAGAACRAGLRTRGCRAGYCPCPGS